MILRYKWKNIIESLTYQFTQDINELRSLIENFNNRELGLQLGFNRIFTVAYELTYYCMKYIL